MRFKVKPKLTPEKLKKRMHKFKPINLRFASADIIDSYNYIPDKLLAEIVTRLTRKQKPFNHEVFSDADFY